MFSTISSAPAKQSVSETISVLSGRLSSATLLEDRRAAILGLRSFAKDYPATVSSGALRSLIGSLSSDGEDVDTVKVVLETLLMLFNPSEDSPEASDEIFLWLADEFTQRQENITLLLDFLDSSDFYSRLYCLQLLIAILSARTERTEECIFTAPLGISRLVGILDDQRDAVRAEAITLLTYLTPSSTDVQKLVAFENAFDRLFAIIASDGDLADGGRTVEDCLILLANLLRRNPSNQSLFRESGGILRLSKSLEAVVGSSGDDEDDTVASWAEAQRNRNIYALLALVRLLLVEGAVGTQHNQAALWKHGFLYHALQLSFSHVALTPIKAEALVTCADIIKGNAALQENFAQLQVPSPIVSPGPASNGTSQANGDTSIAYVIDGLLDLTLTVSALDAFDVRRAACDCLKAYFFKHHDIQLHFLTRAIEGHQSGVDETANALTVLLRPNPEDAITNPYRVWFAAMITLHLLFDNPEAKSLARAVTEGDAESGEEVVTGIQIVAAHLVSSLNRELDSRVVTAYLMLLLGWIFEDLDAVNDFLSEGSNTQSLIQAVIRQGPVDDIVQGLCALLLGEIYEFSTKDSPIPRSDLHSILLTRMGRERFADKLSKLRSHPFMRDFEVLPQKLDPTTGLLPDVFFDVLFVDFFKDNYSRLLRAIDREPGMEISVVSNGVQKGISREMVDSLKAQLDEKEKALQDSQVAAATLERRFGQEEADHKRSRERAAADLARVQSDTDAAARNHEARMGELRQELATAQQDHKRHLEKVQKAHEAEKEELRRKETSTQEDCKRQIEYVKKTSEAEVEKLRRKAQATSEDHQKQLEQAKKAASAEAERLKGRAEADAADLRATISRLEVDLMKAKKEKTQELQALRDAQTEALKQKDEEIKQKEGELKKEMQRKEEALQKHKEESKRQQDELRGKSESSDTELKSLRKNIKALEQKLKASEDTSAKTKRSLEEAEEAKASTQTELDDLLMVFADLEEKATKYKERLKEKGEEVSEDDDDDDDDEDDEDDEEEDESEEEEVEEKKVEPPTPKGKKSGKKG